MKILLSLILCFYTLYTAAQVREKGPNGKWGIVDFDGELMLPYEYDEFRIPRLDTITPAIKNGKKGVLNEKGQVLVPFEYTQLENWLPGFGYQHGLFAVSKSDKNANWGFIDQQGKVVLPLYYEYVRCITRDLIVARPARDTILQFFDGKGQILFKMPGKRAEPVDYMDNAFAVAAVHGGGSKRYYLDGTPFPNEMLWETGQYVIGRKPSGCGITDKRGRVILPYEYGSIRRAAPGQWIVEKGENIKGVINGGGTFIVPVDTQYIDLNGALYVVTPVAQPEHSVLIDSTGREILPLDQWHFSRSWIAEGFRNLPGYHPERYIQVRKNKENLNGLYRADGKEIVPIRFFLVHYCTDQHALLVFRDTGMGIMEAYDFEGKGLLDGAYRSLHFTSDPGLLYGCKSEAPDQWGFIRLADRGASATFEFEEINIISKQYLKVRKAGMCQPLGLDGKPLTAAVYTRLSEPNKYELKHFSRMPGFKGRLVAVAWKADTPKNLVIGINDKGQEFLLDVEAEKAALQQEIDREKSAYKAVVPEPPNSDEAVIVEAPGGMEEENPVSRADEVFDIVDQMPAFPGGEVALLKFLNLQLKYPALARENGIQGKVMLQYIVEIDGRLSDIKILRDIGGGCGQEALRMFKLMPKWVPGKQKGRAVRVKMSYPVVFKLE